MYGLYRTAPVVGKNLLSLHRSEAAAYAKRESFRGHMLALGMSDLENQISKYTVEEIVVDLHDEDE